MQLSNSQLLKQHERLACILNMAIKSKNKANKAMAEVNRLTRLHKPHNEIGESIWSFKHAHNDSMKVYERLMRYYRKQLQPLIGEGYVHINSMATL